MTPILTVGQLNGKFAIFADSYGMKTVAGPRMFRAPPHPDIQFSGYESEAQASKDCEKLWRYLEALPVKKAKKKDKAMREVYQ